jgi:uncharacterized protein YndB with AHSA1/START domain
MTDRHTDHSTFTIERTYQATPQRVFRAISDQATKARWFTPPEGWGGAFDHHLDFRVGGEEHLKVQPPGEKPHIFDARYYDIVPDQRVVFAYEMHIGDVRLSVSLTTMEIEPVADGTRFVFTEQVVFLDGTDNVADRESGSHGLLDKLGAVVEADQD